MASISKKIQENNELLDKLYLTDNGATIISWLDKIKTYKSTDITIPGLLNNSKIKIVTSNKDGVYNLILLWINDNIDKFRDYDFTGIPNYQDLLLKKEMKTMEEVNMWYSNPEIHPITKKAIKVLSNEYKNIYYIAFNILRNNKIKTHDISKYLPNNHMLFGNIDLLFYDSCYKTHIYSNLIKIYKYNMKTFYVCYLLNTNFKDLEDNYDTILEIELALLESIFSDFYANDIILDYKKKLITAFFKLNYIDLYPYPLRMENLEKYTIGEDATINEAYYFIKLLENNRLSNGELIIDYLNNITPYRPDDVPSRSSSSNKWARNATKVYDIYKAIYKEIDDCYNPDSGIIENSDNKMYEPINDPLDTYFEYFEKKLVKIKKPVYSKLIDLTTFKPIENLFYLNNVEYNAFKIVKDKYDGEKKLYEEKRKQYDRTRSSGRSSRSGSSPTPPVKPIILLSNGKNHTIGRELDPLYIKDKVIKSFRRDYKKAFPIIKEYNRIKTLSYLELIKNVSGASPSSYAKQIIRDNKLLSMTKKEITDNVLYDYTGLVDKCSESIDILTNEELDEENYPLSKLQLMVRMKVYTPDKKNYRTECIYAPKLYNYLIKCINSKEPFVNPVTKTKYTKENINELIKVMKVIDPSIEVPIFIKHMNDTKLKLEYKTITITYPNLDSSFGDISSIRFYNIYLSRYLDGTDYNIYKLCTIPMDIEAGGVFATGSSDLTSQVMLFRIYKMFNEGRLLHKYIPPYRIELPFSQNLSYIKPEIHFNKYRETKHWIDIGDNKTKEDFINTFKHYAEEINNYNYL